MIGYPERSNGKDYRALRDLAAALPIGFRGERVTDRQDQRYLSIKVYKLLEAHHGHPAAYERWHMLKSIALGRLSPELDPDGYIMGVIALISLGDWLIQKLISADPIQRYQGQIPPIVNDVTTIAKVAIQIASDLPISSALIDKLKSETAKIDNSYREWVV